MSQDVRMTELQEARAKWLDAETRILALERENFRLRDENHALQMWVITSECQATIMETFAKAAMRVA